MNNSNTFKKSHLDWDTGEFIDTSEDVLSLVPPELFHLLPGFLERRENEVLELSEYLRDGKFGAVKSIGHKLKGTGTGYGFEVVTSIGKSLEEAALQQDIDAVQHSITQLSIFTQGLRALLKADSAHK